MALQIRRGTDSQRQGITPAEGELIYTTDTDKLYIGDGSTVGGIEVSGGTDSAAVQGIINASSINAATLDGENPSYYLDYGNLTNVPATQTDSSTVDSIILNLVDSAYVQARETAQDFAYSSLTGTPTIPTNNSQLANGAAYVTQAAVDSAIDAMIGGAPGALDTLNELAASINDDASFASSVTTSLGTKLNKAGDTLTGTLVSQHIQPTTDDTYDLGSPTKRYRDLYLGPGSLYVNNKKVIEDDAGTITVKTDSDQNLSIKTLGTGQTTLQSAAGLNLTSTGSADISFTTSTGQIELNGDVILNASNSINSSNANPINFGDNIDLNSNKIVNVGTPTNVTDAVNKTYVDNLDVSTFTNDAGYLTSATAGGLDSANVSAIITSDVDAAYVQARQTPQDFAYSSLTGTPTIPTNNNELTNGAGYLTSTIDTNITPDADGTRSFGTTSNRFDNFFGKNLYLNEQNGGIYFKNGNSGSDALVLKNVSGQLFAYPTKILPGAGNDVQVEPNVGSGGAFDVNNARIKNVGTPTQNTDAATKSYVDTNSFSGNYNDLTNTPTLFDGAYSSLTGVPTTFAPSGVDASATTALIDSSYVQARQSNGYSTGTVDAILIDGNSNSDTTYDNVFWTAGSDTSGAGYNQGGGLSWNSTDGKVTVSSGGLYEIKFHAYLTSSGDGLNHNQRFHLWLNGSQKISAFIHKYMGSDDNGVQVGTATLPLNAGDYIQIRGASGSAWRPRVYGGSGHTYLQVIKQENGVLDTGIDSSTITSIIDSNYVIARAASAGLDSSSTIALIDSAYVQARQTSTDLTNYRTATQIESMIDSNVNAIVDAAPGALDTLNELAAALGDDANFSTTITNQIAGKLDSAQAIATITGADLDMGGNKVLFGNMYANVSDLPNASTYHGMFAHVHSTGAGYFAHAGNWVRLANQSEISTYGNSDVTTLVDSAYVQARQTSGGGGTVDSADIIAIVDSSYVAARTGSNSLTVNYTPASKYARLTMSSNQTGISGSVALTTFNTRDVDTSTGNALTSTLGDGKFIIPAGVTKVQLRASVMTSSITDQLTLEIKKNGSRLSSGSTNIDISSTGRDHAAAYTGIVDVVENDYFQLFMFSQNSRTAEADEFSWFELEVVEGSMLNTAVASTIELSNLSNVHTATPTNGQALVWNSANQYWEPNTVSGGSGTVDSADIIAIVDSAYVQARQTSGGGSGASISSLDRSVFTFTATSNQTVFTGTAGSGGTLSFNDEVDVYINGILLDPTDYTLSGGNTLTLASGTGVGNIVTVIDYGATSLSTPTISTFNYVATAGQTNFSGNDKDNQALSYTVDKVNVYVNGILLVDSDDFIATTGNSVVLQSAANADDIISVVAYTVGVVGTLDSDGVTNLIDSAYIQARQSASSAFDSNDAINLIDSAYVQARQSTASDLTNYRTVTQIESMIDSNVNAVIDAAPGALDTLNELAAALGDDANFSTTVTNSIAEKIDSAQAISIITSYGYSTYDSDNAKELKHDDGLFIKRTTQGTSSSGAKLRFTSRTDATQIGTIEYFHTDDAVRTGSNDGFKFSGNETNTAFLFDGILRTGGALEVTSGGVLDGNFSATDGSIEFTSNLNMNNNEIISSNYLTFNDPGVGEGIRWTGGNGWEIFEAPDSFTNASGNLQFSTGTSASDRMMTIGTNGNLELPAGRLTQISDDPLRIHTATNNPTNGARLEFSDEAGGSYTQTGTIKYEHANSKATSAGIDGAGDIFTIEGTENITGIKLDGRLLVTDSAVFQGNVDFGSNQITYSNVYSTTSDLPSASTYHGMFAHVHATGKGYFAHAGNWIELANNSQLSNSSNWDTAYGWGDHSSAGYLTSATTTALVDSAYVQARQTSGGGGVDSAAITGMIDSAYVQARQTSGGGSAITIQEEGVSLSTAAETINFVGSGVTASGSGTTKTITINSGGGSGSGSAFNARTYNFTAAANQTAFSGTDDDGQSLVITDENVNVYMNGILLIRNTDYSIASNTLTLTSAADSDNVLSVVSYTGGAVGLDSSATNDLIDTAIINTNVSDLVGDDGGYGQLLASLGNGDTQWTDLKLPNYTVPSSTHTGTTGDVSFDDNYLYVCISTNNWNRIAYTDSSW